MRGNVVVALVVCISFVPAVLIALLAPSDVLAAYPLLQGYVSVCEAVIPGISRLARISGFPEVTRLVLAVTWTLVPLQIALCAAWLPLRVDWELLRQRRVIVAFVALIGAFAVVSFAVLFDIEPHDIDGRRLLNDWAMRAVSRSRLWLGVIAGLMVSGAALLLYLLFFTLRNFRTIYLPTKGAS